MPLQTRFVLIEFSGMTGLVAVYGSLRAGLQNHHLLSGARLVAREHLKGFALYDLGQFPAAVKDRRRTILVEVYEVQEHHIERLDQLEWFFPADRAASLYIREQVQTSPGMSWVYIYNRHLGDTPHVSSGDWSKHCRNRV